MQTILIIVGVAVFAGFWLIYREIKKSREIKPDGTPMVLLQNQLAELSRVLDMKLGESTKTLDTKLSESTQAMQRQFGESARIVRDVTERLTKLDETNRQVVGFADQLKNLQDILKNPKQRGILGEYYLETVLKNVLPPGSYEMQYKFKSGVIVDAVVFLAERIVPVDSKFSLENYNRILEAREPLQKKQYESAFLSDIKTRIDETSKYVKPEENTMDFAFMFIPSEAVYYDLLINKVGAVEADTNSLIGYAAKKKVIIVSPTSFLAYLQTVLQGLKNQKISEEAQTIVKHVENLGRHLLGFEDFLQKMGKNLGTTVGMYNSAYKEFGKIDKDVLKITGKATGIAPALVEKPSAQEEMF